MTESSELTESISILPLAIVEDPKTTYERIKTNTRFCFLMFICFVEFGRYYCIDLVSPLQVDIMNVFLQQFQQYGINNSQYNALYAAYSFPNVILPFFMGYVIDKVGRPICFLVFLSLVTLGQCTFAISAHPSLNSFWLALAGRFLFGAFGKSVTGNLTIFVVTQSAYLSEWFKTRELALALGFVTCLSRSGTVLNFLVASKTLALSKSVGFALWVGTFLMLISVVSGLISLLIDQHVSIKSHYNPKQAKSRNHFK